MNEIQFSSVITVNHHVSSSSSSSSFQSVQMLGPSLLTLLRADHHLGNKVDDGARRLLRVVLSEQVAHVVRGRAGLPRHEAEDPAEAEQSAQLRCNNTPSHRTSAKMSIPGQNSRGVAYFAEGQPSLFHLGASEERDKENGHFNFHL